MATTQLQLPTPGTYAVDPSHTTVGFVARHLMVTKVRGRFTRFSGVVVVGDPAELSSVEVTIEADSFDTGDAQRDGHVKAADFLDVERFPTLAFRSTGVRNVGDEWDVDGELTVRDVTRPVTLRVAYEGAATDPWGNERAAFSATAEIDREDFGITWNQTLETGGVLVSKKVRLELDVQTVKQA